MKEEVLGRGGKVCGKGGTGWFKSGRYTGPIKGAALNLSVLKFIYPFVCLSVCSSVYILEHATGGESEG